MIKTSALLLGLGLLAGCGATEPDATRAALQQTIVPLCGGDHSVSAATGHAVAQLRSECKPAAAPQ